MAGGNPGRDCLVSQRRISALSAELLVALLSLAAWIYLLGFRGMFWLFRERDDGCRRSAFAAVTPRPVRQWPADARGAPPSPSRGEGFLADTRWPSVVAVVPSRNEADCIERPLRSLAAQDYPGEFRIIAVDDQSTDDTGSRIRGLASERITLISAGARPAGWTGKLWALNQGIAAAGGTGPEFLWLTDADIEHSRDNLSQLVSRAETRSLVLVSQMAKLSCESPSERFLIPAFVFFFALLFPFPRVNNRRRRTAAGAGGCMLVRRSALVSSGGIAAVRGEIIDDCALARQLKRTGPIWLGLTCRAVSIRPYLDFTGIRAMVARSAFAQLDYSWTLLVLTLLGMGLVYGAPPVLAIFATGGARIAGALAWICMAVAFWPISRFYRRSPLWGLALPAISACYAAFTLDSAVQHLCGRGGMWKGRAQATPAVLSSDRDRRLRTAKLSSGKTHRDENFPVASRLIAPHHRGIVLAFYRFVREADDIADHAEASTDQKLRLLEQMRLSLVGESDSVASGIKLRKLLLQRGLLPVHALDLLEAFRRDVTKLRYRDWDDLINYCSVSAMPVGRFVLDVHGESRAVWRCNDALCAALQIINHLQDCGADYANLNRVYIPLDAFAAQGLAPDALSQRPASAELRDVFRSIAARNQVLLEQAAPFAGSIRDRRLSLEVGVIHRLAVDLNRRLLTRDPLSQRVHHGRIEALMIAASSVAWQILPLRFRQRPAVTAQRR